MLENTKQNVMEINEFVNLVTLTTMCLFFIMKLLVYVISKIKL